MLPARISRTWRRVRVFLAGMEPANQRTVARQAQDGCRLRARRRRGLIAGYALAAIGWSGSLVTNAQWPVVGLWRRELGAMCGDSL